MIADSVVPIEVGDAILRALPSGLVDRLVVTDPGFFARNRGMPAHYQVKFRKEGQAPASTPGYHVHVSGPNSRVNINSVDQSGNTATYNSEDLSKLAEELAKLRENLVTQAQGPEHFAAIGAIASAEMAANANEPSKIPTALSALGSAGKWVLDAAKSIGTPLAVEFLRKQAGL